MENNENMIEWQTNARTATVTFTNQKHINRIKKLVKDISDSNMDKKQDWINKLEKLCK